MARPISDDSNQARLLREIYPGSFYCGRCGNPFSKEPKNWHTTWYGDHSGCFPLCEGCWRLLGCAEARIEYYGELIAHWESGGNVVTDEHKHLIMKAVANGG